MILNEYDQLFREYFDISDTPTRKCIVNLEDGEQEQLLTALSSKLYDMIVAKVDQIDFGTIPKSRGDITKVDGFQNTENCLKIIRQLVLEYKQDPECVDSVITAIQNIKDRKGLFMKAFSLNVEMGMLLYNTAVLAIEQSVSFLIAVCIVYIKDPDIQAMNAALDKVAYQNARDNLLFEQITLFNTGCASKDIDHTIEEIIKNGGKIKECGEGYGSEYNQEEPQQPPIPVQYDEPQEAPAAGGNVDPGYESINGSNKEEIDPQDSVQEVSPGIIAAGIVLAPGIIALGLKGIKALIKVIIPFLRNLVYFFINSRDKFADNLATQAQFIEANAYKLKYSTTTELSDEKRNKIITKQLKIAKRLQAMSNKISVKTKKAEIEAKKMAIQDMQKQKISDIKDNVPNEIYDKSVLF